MEDSGSIRGVEDPLQKGMATHSSVPDWEIPWTEECSGLQSMESQRAGHDWEINTLNRVLGDRRAL